MRIARTLFLTTATTLTLCACGNGGGGDDDTSDPTDPAVTGPTVRGVAPITRVQNTLGNDPRSFTIDVDVAAYDVVFAATAEESDMVAPVGVSALFSESFGFNTTSADGTVEATVSYALNDVTCAVQGQDTISDTFLLFDRSFSVGSGIVDDFENAGDAFADNLGAGDRAAVGQFSGQINDAMLDLLTGGEGASAFIDNTADIRSAINQLASVSSGSSPLFDALGASFATFDRGEEATRAVTLFTNDAIDTSSATLTLNDVADQAADDQIQLYLANFGDASSASFERVALDSGGAVWSAATSSEFSQYGASLGALIGGDAISCTANITATLTTDDGEDFPLDDLGFGPGASRSAKAPLSFLYQADDGDGAQDDFIAANQIVVPFGVGVRVGSVQSSGDEVFAFDSEASVSTCLAAEEDGERENICTVPVFVSICDRDNVCSFEGELQPGETVAFGEDDEAAVCRREPVDSDTYRPARIVSGETPDQVFGTWIPFPDGATDDTGADVAPLAPICLFSERF